MSKYGYTPSYITAIETTTLVFDVDSVTQISGPNDDPIGQQLTISGGTGSVTGGDVQIAGGSGGTQIGDVSIIGNEARVSNTVDGTINITSSGVNIFTPDVNTSNNVMIKTGASGITGGDININGGDSTSSLSGSVSLSAGGSIGHRRKGRRRRE